MGITSVLAVDDGASDRELLATVLRYAGYSVLEAVTGERALELARALRPDLIIADILMPTIDGYELLRELRNGPTTAGVPVIFFLHDHVPGRGGEAARRRVRGLTHPDQAVRIEEIIR